VFATAGGLGEKSKEWFFEKAASVLMPQKEGYVDGVRKRTGVLKGSVLRVYAAVNGAPPAVFSPLHLISQAFAHDHVHPCVSSHLTNRKNTAPPSWNKVWDFPLGFSLDIQFRRARWAGL
jgi:hypothetical protein